MPSIKTTAPAVFPLPAHPVRWQLVAALALSDRRVQELVDVVGHPQNFVSYHLKHLRLAGLVRERRSIADGRDVYYTLELGALREQLAALGTLLHPALTPLWLAPHWPDSRLAYPPVRVLFVCTHNSARSQIAEAILRQATPGAVVAFSAGTHPTTVHPLAVAALTALGVPSADLFAKPLDHFAEEAFDYVITVCDRARTEIPAHLTTTRLIHWSLPDPVDVVPPALAPFAATAQEIATRLPHFLSRVAQECA